MSKSPDLTNSFFNFFLVNIGSNSVQKQAPLDFALTRNNFNQYDPANLTTPMTQENFIPSQQHLMITSYQNKGAKTWTEIPCRFPSITSSSIFFQYQNLIEKMSSKNKYAHPKMVILEEEYFF